MHFVASYQAYCYLLPKPHHWSKIVLMWSVRTHCLDGTRAASTVNELMPLLVWVATSCVQHDFYYLLAFTFFPLIFSSSKRGSFILHPHLPDIPALERVLLKAGTRTRSLSEPYGNLTAAVTTSPCALAQRLHYSAWALCPPGDEQRRCCGLELVCGTHHRLAAAFF